VQSRTGEGGCYSNWAHFRGRDASGKRGNGAAIVGLGQWEKITSVNVDRERFFRYEALAAAELK
jgi:hypothetical protein